MGDYCSSADISRFLHISDFSGSTTPTTTEVETLIDAKEDEIDYRTQHAWRLRHSGTDSGSDTTQKYEYYDLNRARYIYSVGIPVYLQHRLIRSLDDGQGDVIEVWDGNQYLDWISDAGHVEGRNEDYHLEAEKGVLYIRNWTRYYRGLRIKYRYGDTNVPADIRNACVKMVAIDLVTNDDRSVNLPDGTSMVSYHGKVDLWQRDIDRTIANHAEMVYATL